MLQHLFLLSPGTPQLSHSSPEQLFPLATHSRGTVCILPVCAKRRSSSYKPAAARLARFGCTAGEKERILPRIKLVCAAGDGAAADDGAADRGRRRKRAQLRAVPQPGALVGLAQGKGVFHNGMGGERKIQSHGQNTGSDKLNERQ